MEVPCPRMDGRDSWYRNWKPMTARTSEAHRHSVSLGADHGHRRQDLAWQKADHGDARPLSHGDDAELHVLIGFEVSIG